ncbi:hypothetical protein ACVDFE_02245 [Lentzea chajnantorensis]
MLLDWALGWLLERGRAVQNARRAAADPAAARRVQALIAAVDRGRRMSAAELAEEVGRG